MRTIKQLTNNKFLNIKEITDKENHVNGFQFAERRGIDSVAFICYDKNTKQFLINNEYKPPVNMYILSAFGGSFDKDKEPIDIVIDEVKEESGFVATKNDVKLVGKVLVSTQMNQFCHLYLVFVDKKEQGEREPENQIEANASTEWMNRKEICDLQDWKAITIISMAESKNIV